MERKSMEKYEQPPARESIRRGEQEREKAAEKERREMRRQTTSGMMHPTMDYQRLLLQPGIISQRIDLGGLITEASGLADYPVRKIAYPIGCGETGQ